MNRSKQIEAAQFRYDLLSVGMNGRDWTSTKRTNFSYKIHWTRFAYQSEVMKLKINSANQRQFLPIRYGPIQFEEFYVFFSFSLLSQHAYVIIESMYDVWIRLSACAYNCTTFWCINTGNGGMISHRNSSTNSFTYIFHWMPIRWQQIFCCCRVLLLPQWLTRQNYVSNVVIMLVKSRWIHMGWWNCKLTYGREKNENKKKKLL